MSIKLSDTQLAMMRAAAQRDDRCLTPSPTLKDGAAQKVAAKLIAAKLVREIKAKAGTPVWRRDGEGGQPLALKLTAAAECLRPQVFVSRDADPGRAFVAATPAKRHCQSNGTSSAYGTACPNPSGC